MSDGKDEALVRLQALLGEAAVAHYQQLHVVVIGLGAVGGACVEALARSGIGRLTLIDRDRFERSNLNRQPFSTLAAIGQEKAAVTQQTVEGFAPCCEVQARSLSLTPENVPALLEELRPDAIVDAIDDVPAKVALLAYAAQQKLKIYSAMGAARKLDPTRLRVADISKTSVCPLARAVRLALRAQGISRGVTCVYSDEPAQPMSAGAPLGSYMPVTASAGLLLAAQLLKDFRE